MNRKESAAPINPPNEGPNNFAYMEEEHDFDPREQLDVFWRRRWAVLAVMVVTVGLGVLYTWTRKPVFSATAKVAITTTSSKNTPSSDDIINILSGNTNRNVDTQAEILRSPDLLDKAYAALPDKVRQKGFGSPAYPQWAISVESTDDSDVINIATKAYSAKAAADWANQIADTYLKQDVAAASQSTKNSREYVQRELQQSQTRLANAAKKLADYKRESVLIADTQISLAAQQVETLRANLDTANSDLMASRRQLSAITSRQKELPGMIASMQVVQENPSYATSRTKLAELQASLSAAQQEYTDTAPEVVAIKNQIAAEEAKMASITKSILTSQTTQRNPVSDQLQEAYSTALVAAASAEAKRDAASRLLSERESALLTFPEKQRKLAELQLGVDILQRTYNLLSDKYWALLIQEQSTLPFGNVIAKARPPQFASYPQKLQNLVMFTFLGLLLGIAVAKLLERFDTRVHDPITVDRITGRPVLTVVPEVHADNLGDNRQVLIGMVDNNHAFLESFRLLRNNIAFSAPDQQLRALSVTSAGKGEGKSTTSVNLAIAMAMDGKRVLLIDGDLRRPTVHNYLDVSREVGFTNVVKGLTTLDEAVIKTDYENVYVLPAGPLPPNPTEFLNSQQARKVVEDAKERFDLVVMDSPPCTGLSDVQVISTLVDGVVLVVALETTQKQYLMATMRLLRQADAPVLGTVINRVQHKRHAYGYYSYYYGYGYAYAYAYSYSYQQEDENDSRKKRKRKTRRRTDK